MKPEETNTNELIEKYLSQNSRAQKNEYDDEIRAEADLCEECCSCCRVCWIRLS
jgi:hypothetical protein